MIRAMQIGVLAVLFVTTAAVGFCGWYATRLMQSGIDLAVSLKTDTHTLAQGGGKTLDALNRDCSGGKERCGTLADVNQTLHSIRGIFGLIETAAKHENAQLTTLDGQERDLFSDLKSTLSGARETLTAATGFANAASKTLGTTQDTLKTSQTTLTQLGDASKALADRLNDPHVIALMTYLESTAHHGDNIAGNLDKMSGHLEKKVDAPVTWKTRAEAIGTAAAKLGIWALTR